MVVTEQGRESGKEKNIVKFSDRFFERVRGKVALRREGL